MPYAWLYQCRIFSTASFDSPYGLIGFCGWLSEMGTCVGSPYVAHVEENTMSRTPASTIASRRFSVLATLFRKYLRGFCTDSPTYAYAAKWMIDVIRCSASTRATSDASARSPSTSGPHLTAHLWPYTRLSSTTGSEPARAMRLAVWLPMYPAPPTIRTAMSATLADALAYFTRAVNAALVPGGGAPTRTTRFPCTRKSPHAAHEKSLITSPNSSVSPAAVVAPIVRVPE